MKKDYFKLIRFIEYIACLLLLLLGFNKIEEGLIFTGLFRYVYPFLYLVVVIYLLLEFKYRKPFIRLFYMIITLLLLLLSEGIDQANSFIFVFSIIYMFLLLISSLFKNKKNITVDVVKNEEGKLEVGFFSEKHKKQSLLFIVLSSIIFCGSFLLFYLVLEVNVIISFLIGMILCIIVIIVMNLLFNPISKINKLIFKENRINDYLNKINEFKNNNIHSETYNYLLIYESNYTVLVNKAKSIELFESAYYPMNKAYQKLYELIELCYLENKLDKDMFDKRLKEYKKKYPKEKNLKYIGLSFRINDINDVIENIESYYNINHKNMFTRLVGANALMNYYYIRGNLTKAKEYAKIIIEMGANEYIETYNKALSIYEQN